MHTSSPGKFVGTSVAASSKAATAIPKARHWISPVWTGRTGHGAPKREQISVPPVMDESWTLVGNALYTNSNEEGGNTEPVDMMRRNFKRESSDSMSIIER